MHNVYPAPARTLTAVHLNHVDRDPEHNEIVVFSLVCRSGADAANAFRLCDAQLKAGSFDFSGLADIAPAEPFEAGALVYVTIHDEQKGEVEIAATIVRCVDHERRVFRCATGTGQAHVRDMRRRAA